MADGGHNLAVCIVETAVVEADCQNFLVEECDFDFYYIECFEVLDFEEMDLVLGKNSFEVVIELEIHEDSIQTDFDLRILH